MIRTKILVIFFFIILTGCDKQPECNNDETKAAIKEYLFEKLNNRSYLMYGIVDRYDKDVEKNIKRFLEEGIDIVKITPKKSNVKKCRCTSELKITLNQKIKNVLESQQGKEFAEKLLYRNYPFEYSVTPYIESKRGIVIKSNMHFQDLADAMNVYIVLQTQR